MKILLIEDDVRLSSRLKEVFTTNAVACFCAQSLEEFDDIVTLRENFDLIILDRLIGRDDTKSRLSQLRSVWPTIPILILSAINTPNERAELLNLGADDYMGKPFLTEEFVARVRALLRRVRQPDLYRKMGNCVLDIHRRALLINEQYELLPSKEFLILKVLSDDMGRVLNRTELLDRVWGGAMFAETNVVEATITNLRRRLMNLSVDVQIKNMRNTGYWIEG